MIHGTRMLHAWGDETSTEAQMIRAHCFQIRTNVFVTEQHVPCERELDEHDSSPTTCHLLLVDGAGTPLATGRLLNPHSEDGVTHLHVGRIAVSASGRGRGLGAALMAELERVARRHYRGQIILHLSAQEQAIGFYERCGYTLLPGDPYDDAGILHRDMSKRV